MWLKPKVYLADIKDYGKMNESYRSYFKNDPPARTCIAISKLVRDRGWRLLLLLRSSRQGALGPKF